MGARACVIIIVEINNGDSDAVTAGRPLGGGINNVINTEDDMQIFSVTINVSCPYYCNICTHTYTQIRTKQYHETNIHQAGKVLKNAKEKKRLRRRKRAIIKNALGMHSCVCALH